MGTRPSGWKVRSKETYRYDHRMQLSNEDAHEGSCNP